MDITLKLSKDFERCLEDLKKKYGEDLSISMVFIRASWTSPSLLTIS